MMEEMDPLIQLEADKIVNWEALLETSLSSGTASGNNVFLPNAFKI